MFALCDSADDFVRYNGKKDNRYMKNKNDWLDFISATGITVLQAKSADNTLTLNNISLPKGVYLVKIVQDNNVLSVKRVIKL